MEIITMDQKDRRDRLVSSLTERRKHPRIPLRLPTQYFPEGKTRKRLCHTINIGEGGAMLCLPEKMEVGQKLRFEIYYYFDYELEKFNATGEVLWAEKTEDASPGYRCALEFVDLAIRDFEKLKKFLRKIFA